MLIALGAVPRTHAGSGLAHLCISLPSLYLTHSAPPHHPELHLLCQPAYSPGISPSHLHFPFPLVLRAFSRDFE